MLFLCDCFIFLLGPCHSITLKSGVFCQHSCLSIGLYLVWYSSIHGLQRMLRSLRRGELGRIEMALFSSIIKSEILLLNSIKGLVQSVPKYPTIIIQFFDQKQFEYFIITQTGNPSFIFYRLIVRPVSTHLITQ